MGRNCAPDDRPPPRTTRPELGILEDGPEFVNVVNAGLAPAAARAATPLKPRLGPLAYAVGALKAAVSTSPLECRVEVDGQEFYKGKAWQVIVLFVVVLGGIYLGLMTPTEAAAVGAVAALLMLMGELRSGVMPIRVGSCS